MLIAPDRTWKWKGEGEFDAQTGHQFFWDEVLWDEVVAVQIRAE